MIIALSGKIGSGKDRTGSEIIRLTTPTPEVSRFPLPDSLKGRPTWENKKFAAKLKQIASIMTGIPVEKFEDQEFKKSYLGPESNLMATTVYGDEFVEPMTVRDFLQRLGTDAVRMGLHKNAWVNALFADYTPESKWVITDCRFPNEAEAIKAKGGILVRIDRPSLPVQQNPHESETALDNWNFDYRIVNSAGLEELDAKVAELLTAIGISYDKD